MQNEWDIGACCIQDASSQPDSPLPALPSGVSAKSQVDKTGKRLNVAAIAIGVTGAVLLLAVLGAIIFYLRKRKRKEKLPPSAEFTTVAAIWHPRLYYETTSESPTTSTFTPKDARSFASSPFEPLRYNAPCPTTPPHLP